MLKPEPNTEHSPVLEITALTQQFGGLRAVSNFSVRLQAGKSSA